MTTNTKKAAAKMLTAEEEKDLVARAKAGDMRARDRVIAAHLPLAHKAARSAAARSTTSFEDALSIASFELVKAFDCFDPERGARFCMIAREFIRYALAGNALRGRFHGIQPPAGVKPKDIYYVRKLAVRVAYLAGTPISAAFRSMIEEKIGVTGWKVDEIVAVAMAVPPGSDGIDNVLEEDPVSQETVLMDAERVATLHRCIERLEPRQAEIVKARLQDPPEKLCDIADRIGISLQRIHYIEKKAMAKVTEMVREASGLQASAQRAA